MQPTIKRHHRRRALTLIETVGCITIIGFLAVLIGGVAQKARRKADLKIYQAAMPRVFPAVREDLQKFYSNKTNYPAWSARQLYEMGVFDRQLMRWLENGWVTYAPFSSTTAEDQMVITFFSHQERNGVKVWPGLKKSQIVRHETE